MRYRPWESVMVSLSFSEYQNLFTYDRIVTCLLTYGTSPDSLSCRNDDEQYFDFMYVILRYRQRNGIHWDLYSNSRDAGAMEDAYPADPRIMVEPFKRWRLLSEFGNYQFSRLPNSKISHDFSTPNDKPTVNHNTHLNPSILAINRNHDRRGFSP